MKTMIAFDLDGTLAESKQPMGPEMAERIKSLLEVADVVLLHILCNYRAQIQVNKQWDRS